MVVLAAGKDVEVDEEKGAAAKALVALAMEVEGQKVEVEVEVDVAATEVVAAKGYALKAQRATAEARQARNCKGGTLVVELGVQMVKALRELRTW